MELLEALNTRRSIRQYTADPISTAELQRLVEAAASAPSGGNRQPWAFIIIREPRKLKLLRAAAPGMSGVPAAMIAICLDGLKGETDPGSFAYEVSLLSLGAAMENLLLAAHAQGLGACAIGSFHISSVRCILALPQHLEPKLLIALGHPVSQPKPPSRRPLAEICFFEEVETK